MKTYYVRFGSGNPGPNFGLVPVFLTFNNNGTAVTPPTISSVTGATGFYSFQYGTTTPIVFLIDGATTGLDANSRYVAGSIDPADRSDEYGTTLIAYGLSLLALGATSVALGTTNVALGITSVAQGTTAIAIGTTLTALSTTLGTLGPLVGTVASSFGTNLADPVDLFGYLKRCIENFEGNNSFTKTTGSLQILSRGSSQLLATKTIANSISMVIKT